MVLAAVQEWRLRVDLKRMVSISLRGHQQQLGVLTGREGGEGGGGRGERGEGGEGGGGRGERGEGSSD